MPFVADYFDFNEYYTTTSYQTAYNYLRTDKDNDGQSDYYIVAVCTSGLWTTGGHYITMVADNNGTITVYDPYLYSGKFATASRRSAGVVVRGNSAYVSESAFTNYSNVRNFWIFSNDKGKGSNGSDTSNVSEVSQTRYVSTQNSNLNVRSGAGTNYSIVTSLRKGTAVTVSKIDGSWSYITSPVTGWVSTQYLSSSAVMSNKTSSVSSITNSKNYSVGTYKVTASLLNVRSGAGTNYKTKTYKQLTANARKQNQRLGNYYANGYKKGVVCTVTQVNGNWGKTSSGWICLNYCTKL